MWWQPVLCVYSLIWQHNRQYVNVFELSSSFKEVFSAIFLLYKQLLQQNIRRHDSFPFLTDWQPVMWCSSTKPNDLLRWWFSAHQCKDLNILSSWCPWAGLYSSQCFRVSPSVNSICQDALKHQHMMFRCLFDWRWLELYVLYSLCEKFKKFRRMNSNTD